MNFINTHSHVYSQEFDNDRDDVIARAIELGVSKLLLPDIDASERVRMLDVASKYPQACFPMLGVHPTSIKQNYTDELRLLDKALLNNKIIAIGEIGIDLYWDKTYYNEQVIAFIYQMNLAKELGLPVVIHVRNSFDEIFKALDTLESNTFSGVFHCFSGNLQQAIATINLGFYIGIGGVVTYKNSGLDDVVRNIPLEHIILETDDPWLAPVPHRGKRNEPSYVVHIAKKIAEIKEISIEEVARITTANAQKLFSLT